MMCHSRHLRLQLRLASVWGRTRRSGSGPVLMDRLSTSPISMSMRLRPMPNHHGRALNRSFHGTGSDKQQIAPEFDPNDPRIPWMSAIDMSVVRGLNALGKQREGATYDLSEALVEFEPNTRVLGLIGDVPTNAEWLELGRHFTTLCSLQIHTGDDQCWVDENFPLHWPLQTLAIENACNERISTQAILEGRVENLVLSFTSALRFEGPTNEELLKGAEVTQSGGRPMRYLKEKVNEWMRENYRNKGLTFSSDSTNDPPSKLKKLVILGNDALETLTRIALARFHLLRGLDSLTVYSVSRYDLSEFTADLFSLFLPELTKLTHLRLTLSGSAVSRLTEGARGKPFHEWLPSNLERLEFRGPASMAWHLEEFMVAIGKPEYLPKLKHISFVLDLPEYLPEIMEEEGHEAPHVTDQQLKAAIWTCCWIWARANTRGVTPMVFQEPRAVLSSDFQAVDGRWEEMLNNPSS